MSVEQATIVMAIATVLMTVATVFLAIFAFQSNKLSKEIKRMSDLREVEDAQYKQQISDLYQAIVISTLLSGPSSYGAFGQARDAFNSLYKGGTSIFK